MNKLFCADNLAILREMPDNSIDLIATDPPFNTGKNWGAFDDRWEGGLKGYLKFMEPRCVEMHRLLKDTGSFYLHCDPTASHYLKVMLDGVFGFKQFRNNIVWKRTSSHNLVSKRWGNIHDTILFYSKSEDVMFNILLDDEGKPLNSLWTDIPIASRKQRTGYPTQKPVALYQRIIKASSNEGDTVLDPFAGSGTTLDAAYTLRRHWIGIDRSREAIALIEKRLTERHGMFLAYDVVFET